MSRSPIASPVSLPRPTRRAMLAGASLALALAVSRPLHAQEPDFRGFLAGLRAEARQSGVSDAVLHRALDGLQPNAKVLELDRRQPEFTLTWAQYRSTRLSDQRIALGRTAAAQNRALLQAVSARFGVAPSAILGIWGAETNYGGFTGGFNVVEALATLAWDGRRSAYFRKEVIAALQILQHGDVSFARMRGSYAGAMGQPQFMPSSFRTYAVDFDGDGRRDIWDSKPDVLGSIANYLAKSGWRPNEPWGQPVLLPTNFDPNLAGRDNRRPLGDWMASGVRRIDGTGFSRRDVPGTLLLPDGPGGEAFLVYANFAAIKRYNPSDFYALVVGLLGDQVTV